MFEALKRALPNFCPASVFSNYSATEGPLQSGSDRVIDFVVVLPGRIILVECVEKLEVDAVRQAQRRFRRFERDYAASAFDDVDVILCKAIVYQRAAATLRNTQCEKCQPYLLQFDSVNGLAGRVIEMFGGLEDPNLGLLDAKNAGNRVRKIARKLIAMRGRNDRGSAAPKPPTLVAEATASTSAQGPVPSPEQTELIRSLCLALTSLESVEWAQSGAIELFVRAADLGLYLSQNGEKSFRQKKSSFFCNRPVHLSILDLKANQLGNTSEVSARTNLYLTVYA